MTFASVEFSTAEEEDGVDVTVRIGGVRVGYALSIRYGDRLKLCDLKVFEHFTGPQLPPLLRLLRGRQKPAPLRQQGIGSELLRRLIEAADATGIREIFGGIVEKDLLAQPTLLAWYEKRGFAIVEPDADCKNGEVKKIVRRRPSIENPAGHTR